MIALAVLMALVGGCGVGLVLTQRARSVVRSDILSNSLTTVDLAAALSARYVDDAEAAARDLATRDSVQAAVRDDDFNAINVDLERWGVAHPNISVFISDLNGVTRVTSLATKISIGDHRADRDWFQGPMSTGRPLLAAPGVSPATNKARVPYGVPIFDDAGRVRGVLTASIQLDALSQIITSIHVGPNTRAVLFDLNRRLILAHGDPARILTSPSGKNAAVELLVAGQRGVLEDTTSSGEPVLAAFGPVPDLPWGVLIQEPSLDAFAPLDDMARDATWLVSAIVLFAALLGTVLAVRIGRPLKRLRATADGVAGGDLNRRAGLGRQDEIGQVGRAFDNMADRLQASIRRISESETGIRAVMDSVADAIVSFDGDGCIGSCNLAAERLFGYTAIELVGQPVERLVPEAAFHDSRSAWFDAIWSGESVGSIVHECEARRRDGTSISVEVAISEAHQEGRRRLIVVVRDLTERRQAEQQRDSLHRSEKLRALGQMASGIAHDLNQTLMLVTSYSDLARQALIEKPPNLAELEDLLTTTTQAALDGGETVKRLLLFTAAVPEQNRRRINLGTIVDEAAQLTAPRWRDAAQAEGRPISLQIEAEGQPTIDGSPAQLRELMTNLIFNAVDALPTGGTIRLRVAAEDGLGIVEVSDSGVGMSAEVEARMFEPFFTTKGESGSGLGLAMVFGIVEQHGGHIEVRSVPGNGTTIRMSFPMLQPEAELERLAPTTSPPRAEPPLALRVLAVDDEPMMTKAVMRMLKPSGHLVSVAGSGEEALEQLEERPFDVVVSDMGMGAGMNGWELAEAVRCRWPGVRFLLATGWGAAIDSDEARSRGVEAVLAKPYHPADLLAALARHEAAGRRN